MSGEERFGLADEDLAVHPTVYAPGSFDGRVVLVSGGAGGIGRATAWLLARLGAHVIVSGRSEEKIAGLLGALRAQGLACSGHPVDIRDPDGVAAFFDRIWAEHGRLDLVVNSAGGQFPQAAIDFSVKGWNAVINTNLNGTWFMMQTAARKWRDAGQPGSIVNIVVVTTHGLYGVAHTVAARSGVVGLSRSVAVEWAPLGIRVNCVAPGAIETEGWKVYTPQVRAAYPMTNPMMRAGDAWDIAEASVYLGGPAGKFITGEVLTVDGGGQLWGEAWTAGKPDYFKGAGATEAGDGGGTGTGAGGAGARGAGAGSAAGAGPKSAEAEGAGAGGAGPTSAEARSAGAGGAAGAGPQSAETAGAGLVSAARPDGGGES